MFYKFILLISLSFIGSSVWARDPSCKETKQLISSTFAFHVNRPEIDAELILRAGTLYIDSLDPYKIYLTKKEYATIINELTYDADSYLNRFDHDTCNIFKPIEQAVLKGQKRASYFIKRAITLGPKEDIKVHDLKNNISLLKIKDYVVADSRDYLFKNIKDLKSARSFLLHQDNVSKYLGKRKTTFITKSFMSALDPHSNYFTPPEWKEFSAALTGAMTGLGINPSFDYLGLKIEGIIKDSPMEKSKKVVIGDRILKIDDKDIKTLEDLDAALINMSADTVYLITAQKKDGTLVDFDITPARFTLEDAKVSTRIQTVNNKNILIFKVPSFYYDYEEKKGTSEDMRDQFESLMKNNKNPDLIILDLRNNTGGILDQAQRVIGLFVGNKIAVYRKDRQGKSIPQMTECEQPMVNTKIPLIVVENKTSASASEVVSGALKVYGRALIVGDKRTYGKGSVQSIFTNPLSEGLGVLKLTVSTYYLPNGESTQINGVLSDIIIPGPYSKFKISESNNKYALPYSTIKTVVKDTPLNCDIKLLADRSHERVKNLKPLHPKKNIMDFAHEGEDDAMVMNEVLKISNDYLNYLELKGN
jgi:carboxyl-terminal processing protease